MREEFQRLEEIASTASQDLNDGQKRALIIRLETCRPMLYEYIEDLRFTKRPNGASPDYYVSKLDRIDTYIRAILDGEDVVKHQEALSYDLHILGALFRQKSAL